MRGKAQIFERIADTKRITPAYAGKSSAEIMAEHDAEGSPPPMRGKGNMKHYKNLGFGITPAYAGKSSL